MHRHALCMNLATDLAPLEKESCGVESCLKGQSLSAAVEEALVLAISEILQEYSAMVELCLSSLSSPFFPTLS